MNRGARKKQSEVPFTSNRDGQLIKNALDIIRSPEAQKDFETISRLIREGKLPIQKKK